MDRRHAIEAQDAGLHEQHPRRSNDSDFAPLDDGAAQAPRTEPPAAGVRRRPGVIARPLDFTVRVVVQDEDLRRVQALRAAAYGHHLPGMAETFGRADPMDRQADTTVFFAEDKRTGTVVGSCRIQVNDRRPLQIEDSLELPPRLQGCLLSEITRLTVLPGYNHQPVRLALVKACHLYCVARQITGVLAGSRRSLLRQYRALGFQDVFDDERLVPLKHGGNLEHRILFRDTVTAESDARAVNHPDYRFVFRDYHPDIQVLGIVDQAVDAGLRRLRVGGPAWGEAA